jgi:hypothetical protein
MADRRSGLTGEECSLDAVKERRHVDEIDRDIVRDDLVTFRTAVAGGVGDGRQAVDTEVRMRAPEPARAHPANFADRSVARKAEDVEEIVHGAKPLFSGSTSPECEAKLAVGAVVE